MGQLRDFTMNATQSQPKRTVNRRSRSLKMSLWLKQVIWSCILFAVVSGAVKMENDFGNWVQQMLFDNLNMETDLLPVLQPFYAQGEEGGPPIENSGFVAGNPSEEEKAFSLLVPISGIVLKNFAATEDGNMMVTGITIKTPEGGKITNACPGQVATISGDVGNWVVTMTYENWKMVYSGLKDLSVTAGQQINAGTILGNAVEGEIQFALYQDEQPVDPMPYFQVEQ